MVRAHSLLYSIYICLIISIICAAMLYFSNLYNQLNLFYNRHEEMYIHNQSSVNYALASNLANGDIPEIEEGAVRGDFKSYQFGAVAIGITTSYTENDTVSSVHFFGAYGRDEFAICLSNFSKPLAYSGTMKIIGDNKLPDLGVSGKIIEGLKNEIQMSGKNYINESGLPEINESYERMYDNYTGPKISLSESEKSGDSAYFNSFLNPTKQIALEGTVVSGVTCKGNVIIRAKDSMLVRKSAVLDDVILIAPKITFEEGFSGNVQAYATTGIDVSDGIVLRYPSVLCVYNNSSGESKIRIGRNCRISGALVLFGNSLGNVEKNSIEVLEGGLLQGDIYCAGKLMLKSDVYGTVYTNRFFYKTASSSYDNLVAEIEINVKKRPPYFIPIMLFNKNSERHGIIKRVF